MKKHLLSSLAYLLLLLSALPSCSDQEAPNLPAPTLTIGSAVVQGRTIATISGIISIPNGTEMAECGFIYSTVSTLPEAESTIVPLDPHNSNGTNTIQLTKLLPNTHYYYCLYASSGYTTLRSEIGDFVTGADGVPMFEEVTCTAHSETSFTVRCRLTDNGGYDLLDMGFCYKPVENGDDSAPDRNDQLIIVDIVDQQYFTATIDGLQPNTTYIVCAYGSNQLGYGYSAPLSITTDAANAPTVSAITASELTDNASITLAATLLDPGSSEVSEVGFCWSTENNIPNIESNNRQVCTLQTDNQSFSTELTGLNSNTTYYVRAYAINDKGVGYGEVYSFVTPMYTPDVTVVTGEPRYIGIYSAILAGYVMYGTDIKEGGFIFGTSADREELIANGNTYNASILGDEIFTYEVTNLAPATNYYYCTFAISNGETIYGEVVSFSTKEETLELTLNPVRNITSMTAVASVGLNIPDDLDIIERGFCIGKKDSVNEPTIDDTVVAPSATDETTFSASLTGLEPDTEYVIRAFVKVRSGKIIYSSTGEFKTAQLGIPGIDENPSPDRE